MAIGRPGHHQGLADKEGRKQRGRHNHRGNKMANSQTPPKQGLEKSLCLADNCQTRCWSLGRLDTGDTVWRGKPSSAAASWWDESEPGDICTETVFFRTLYWFCVMLVD